MIIRCKFYGLSVEYNFASLCYPCARFQKETFYLHKTKSIHNYLHVVSFSSQVNIDIVYDTIKSYTILFQPKSFLLYGQRVKFRFVFILGNGHVTCQLNITYIICLN